MIFQNRPKFQSPAPPLLAASPATLSRRGCQPGPFQFQQPSLPSQAEGIPSKAAVAPHHAMTGNDNRDGISRQRVAYRPRRLRLSQLPRYPAITSQLSVRYLRGDFQNGLRKARKMSEITRCQERARLSGKVSRQFSPRRRHPAPRKGTAAFLRRAVFLSPSPAEAYLRDPAIRGAYEQPGFHFFLHRFVPLTLDLFALLFSLSSLLARNVN